MIQRSRRILLTGANGFLNSRLYQRYRGAYEMVPMGRGDADVTDHAETRRLLETARPDVIIHGAAMTATAACERDPQRAHAVNVAASVNVARVARDLGARVLFYSSEQVFNGNGAGAPFREDDQPVPNTRYGETKLTAEREMAAVCEDLVILRLSWMYGFPERHLPPGEHLFSRLLRALVGGEPIALPVHEYRCMTAVYDLADRFDGLLALPAGTYHCGSRNNGISTYEVGTLFLREMGVTGGRIDQVVVKDEAKYADRPRDVRLDSSRLAEAGLALPDLPAGIRQFVRAYGLAPGA